MTELNKKREDVENRGIVIFPLYTKFLSEVEMEVLKHNMQVMEESEIAVVTKKTLKDYWEMFINLHGYKNIKIVCFADKCLSSISEYNKLMMSKLFYKKFIEYDYILIVQTDAIIFDNELDFWISKNYSYIGAPWFEGMSKPEKPLSFVGVGNGGFSLRKVNDAIAVLSGFKRIRPIKRLKKNKENWYTFLKEIVSNILFSYNKWPLLPRMNEDLIWGLVIPARFAFFKVPQPEEAANFSFEACPRELYDMTNGKLPFGCHAWQRYDESFWYEVFKSKNILIKKS